MLQRLNWLRNNYCDKISVYLSFGFTNIVGNLYEAVGVISAMFPLTFFIKKMKNSDIMRKNKENRVL